MGSLTTIDFRGDTLFAVRDEDGVFIAIKPICDHLGLDWKAQKNRLWRNPLLAEGVRMTRTPSAGGQQEMTCLALPLINGWLFGIDTARVKPEMRERVLTYQRECYDVLADHFLGPRASARPAREAIEDTNLRAEEHKLAMVREMRLIGGPAKAQALWRMLGLPEVEAETGTRATRASGHAARMAAPDAGEIVATVQAYIRERGAPIGFTGPHGDLYFLEGEWQEVTCGLDPRAAADALHAAGFLVRDPDGRRKVVARVNGRATRVYRLRRRILDA